MFPVAHGGNFKAPAAGQSFAHGHASLMAHAAAKRLQIAKALSSAAVPPPIAARPLGGGLAAPAPTPGGGLALPPSPAGVTPPAPMGNFKAHVAAGAANRGVRVTHQHVMNAITSLTQKGSFSPIQGAALKMHQGPLEGPQGLQAQNLITNEVATNPRVRL